MPGSKKCPDGCTCKKHYVSEEKRKLLSLSRNGITMKKCEPGCTCGHHTRTQYKSCEEGCTCGRHKPQTEEQRKKNSEANRGRKRSAETQGKIRATMIRKYGGPLAPGTLEALHEGLKRSRDAGLISAPNLIDGRTSHPQYHRWHNMIARCTRPNHPEWENYGERGITVCEEWMENPFSFYEFLEEMGPCPPGYSMDRIDNNGNYEPGNIRWASSSEQNANRRTYSQKE